MCVHWNQSIVSSICFTSTCIGCPRAHSQIAGLSHHAYAPLGGGSHPDMSRRLPGCKFFDSLVLAPLSIFNIIWELLNHVLVFREVPHCFSLRVAQDRGTTGRRTTCRGLRRKELKWDGWRVQHKRLRWCGAEGSWQGFHRRTRAETPLAKNVHHQRPDSLIPVSCCSQASWPNGGYCRILTLACC